ncbi:hypothetical protein MesoLj131c_68750 (plasmid) [Mesorhizobium sp. 131-3-5]|uniref:hypothetical protein n=1 Tax=Mesorhizobium sp. 131-3-5 TaxID=2744520 RepID=UPI0018EAAB1D|nr:hypothetical protein [Mesorhizobium sp. 131-3-5]BCH12617.1 hypothetical protein MesoLj131c_68750 [Mesorhizobium sp. 131-3-5]
MHINKIHSVRTIALVARKLGEDENWLAEIAIEMEPEDSLIWIYGPDHEDGVMAFSPFGVESLRNLIAMHRDEYK